jgi:hypothetical protein
VGKAPISHFATAATSAHRSHQYSSRLLKNEKHGFAGASILKTRPTATELTKSFKKKKENMQKVSGQSPIGYFYFWK